MDNLKVEVYKNIDNKTDFAIVYDRDEKHFIDLLREEYLGEIIQDRIDIDDLEHLSTINIDTDSDCYIEISLEAYEHHKILNRN